MPHNRADEGERLSAFMDGELGETDACGVIVACGSKVKLSQDWGIYHCIGDVLRSPEMACHSGRLTESVAARLSGEAHLLAPAVRPVARGARRLWIRPAAAAAVAVVGLLMLGVYPQWTVQRVQEAVVPPASKVAIVPAEVGPAVPNAYVDAHREYSVGLGMRGAVGAVRSVAFDVAK